MYWDMESLMNLSARVVVMRSEVDPHDFEDENNVLKLIILNLWDRLEDVDQLLRSHCADHTEFAPMDRAKET